MRDLVDIMPHSLKENQPFSFGGFPWKEAEGRLFEGPEDMGKGPYNYGIRSIPFPPQCCIPSWQFILND
jgi:hypothetical protein